MNQKTNRTFQTWTLFLPEIKDLLETRNYTELKELLDDIYPIDLAEMWYNFEDEEKLVIFKMLVPPRVVAVFEELDFVDQEFLISKLEDGSLGHVLDEMASDEKAKLFYQLPARTVKKLMSLMKKEEVDKVQRVLKYPEDSAGALMNTDFIDLSPEMTARQALEKVQRLSSLRRVENLYAFYVIDAHGKLLGGVTLRKLIAVPPDLKISAMMVPVGLIRIKPEEDHETVALLFSKYDLTVAPVVAEDNRLIGAIVIDDVVDIIQRLDTKQMYEIGMMDPSDGKQIDYDTASPFSLVKRRIVWLIFLLVMNFLSATILKTFEATLATVMSLTFFLPMLLGTGGNAGTQTSISIIRGLATGEVSFTNVWRIIGIEVIAALIMASLVGMIAFGRAFFVGEGLLFAAVVGGSMGVLIILAITTGLALPLISKKIGLDPASLAGPITTTIVDVIGLIIYFKIAQAVLPQLQ